METYEVDDALEVALEAWLRYRSPNNMQPQVEDCRALASTGLFSNRHLEAITGLPETQIARITRKTDHTGGRLAVHTLPLLMRLRGDYALGLRNERLLRIILNQGTSRATVTKLTGISRKTVVRMIEGAGA